MLRTLALASALVAGCVSGQWMYHGNFTSSNPAYTFIMDLNADGASDLLVNGFAAFSSGSVSSVMNASRALNNMVDQSPEVLFDDLFWPNWAVLAPEGIWESPQTVCLADGFLLPGSTPGNVYCLQLSHQLKVDPCQGQQGKTAVPFL